MKKTILTSTLFTVLAAPALAATVSVSSFNSASYTAATGSMTHAVSQNFESYGVGNVHDGLTTNVGSFKSLGGKGTGGTVTGASFANDGTKLALRDGNVFGRVSTTKTLTGNPADDMFLDSNDTHGIIWHVMLAGQKMFDRIVFTITDAAEFGNSLRIDTEFGTTVVNSSGGGKKRLVEIDFGASVSEAQITLGHFKGNSPLTNDGFSVDDIAVSAVPLPASALLLLGALGGMVALRRRAA